MNFRFIKQAFYTLLLLPAVALAGEVDLSLDVTSPQGEQTIGTTVPFYFQITNNSNTTATNVVFENNFSTSTINRSDLSFVSANSSQGDCTLNGYIIACAIGNISRNSTVEITVEMQIKYVGELSMSANISSDQTDNNELDNAGKAIVNVSTNNVKTYATPLEWNSPAPASSYRNNLGIENPSLSANGKYVSFPSKSKLAPEAAGGIKNIYTINRETKEIGVSSIPNRYEQNHQQANGSSGNTDISNDADLVAFSSKASNIIDNDLNNQPDLFLHRRSTNETYRISVSSYGEGGNKRSTGPNISANGRYVIFVSDANNLINDGNNNSRNIFIHDTRTRVLSRVNIESGGIDGLRSPGGPVISGDGRYIAFLGIATQEYFTYYLWDKNTAQIKQITPNENPDGSIANIPGGLTISDDGRFAVYSLNYYVYRYNIQTGENKIISKNNNSELQNGNSGGGSISADGRYTAYTSIATNLTEEDNTNGFYDIFVYDAINKTTKRVNKGVGGFQTNNHCINPIISADGSTIVYFTKAHNLVFDDTNQVDDIFFVGNPFFTEPAKDVDLSIDKTASASEIEIGKNITYTLTVDNIAIDPEATATEVSIEDVIPNGLVFDSMTHPDNVDCSENSGTISCDLGDIAVGDPPVSIEIIAKTTAKGEIKNTATVSAAETDSDTSNNSSEATIDVIEPTDVYIEGSIASPTDPATEYYIEEELTYNFVVGNNSAITATDVTAIITLPATFSSITALTDVDNSTCVVTGQKITCIFGDDIEKTDKANITVKTTPSAAGNLKVEYEVTISETQTDSNTDNNSDTVQVIVEPKSDLVISVEDSDDPVDGFIYAGNDLTYTITVKNNGPSDATNIEIIDTLPTGITYVSASSGCTQSAEEVICNIGDLANGASKSIDVVIKPTTPETITNIVSVSADEFDHVTTNNSASEDTIVKAIADILIIKESQQTKVAVGDPLTYKITVSNNNIEGSFSGNKATKIVVTDNLPSSVTFVSSTIPCTQSGQQLSCDVIDLEPANDAVFEITVTPGSVEFIENSASVTSEVHDPDTANNDSGNISTEVIPVFTIATSDVPDPVKAGETITLKIDITNNSIKDMGTAQLIYTRPTQFKHQSMTFTQGTCVRNRRVVTCDFGTIAGESTTTLELTLLAKGGAAAETYDHPFAFTADHSGNSITANVVEQTTILRNANLIVQTRGKGKGSVSADPAVIACPGDCRENGMATGDTVTLTATADATSVFQKWTGVCKSAGTNPICTITLNAGNNRAVANFIMQPKLTVKTNGKGSGSVSSDIAGISCPGDCKEVLPAGAVITLTANADSGSSFSKWTGACKSAGTNPVCQITISKSVTATAAFIKNPTVTMVVNGAGTVVSSDGGITCPGDCKEQYPVGDTITLTATPDTGAVFDKWKGACKGKSPTCNLNLKNAQNKTVRAIFK